MKKLHTFHRLLVPLFLLASLVWAASPALASEVPSTEAWYVMDREGWLRTDDSRLVLTTYDLRNGPNLAAVPMQIGDWTGQDLAITNLETFPTLDAEQLVYRGYTHSNGQMLILSLVGSTHGRSFHHPLVCYEWASWPAEDHGTTVVATTDGDVVMRVVIGRDPQGPAQVDLHAYLWPNDRRDWADGATQVRVTALAHQGDEKALATARDFTRLLFSRSRRPGESLTLPPPAAEPRPAQPATTSTAAPASATVEPGSTETAADSGVAPSQSAGGSRPDVPAFR
jgi:hypothetical protein